MSQATGFPLMRLPAELRIMIYKEFTNIVGQDPILSAWTLLWVSKQVQAEYAPTALPRLELEITLWSHKHYPPERNFDDWFESRHAMFRYVEGTTRNKALDLGVPSNHTGKWHRARFMGIVGFIGYLRSVKFGLESGLSNVKPHECPTP